MGTTPGLTREEALEVNPRTELTLARAEIYLARRALDDENEGEFNRHVDALAAAAARLVALKAVW